MDKITYLAELAEGLARWVPERERQDILRYYAEYFEEAGPGREAEVVAELGDPWALSCRLAVEGGYVTHEKAASWRPRKTWPKVLLGTAVGLSIFALIAGIGLLAFNIVGFNPIWSDVAVSASEGLVLEYRLEGDNVALVEAGEFTDFFSTGDGSLDAFGSIDADISLGNIEVLAGDDFTLSVWLSEAMSGYKPELEIKDGVLKLRDGDLPRQAQVDSWDDLKKLFNVNHWSMEVVITVPEGAALDNINVETGVGNVLLWGVNAETVTAETGVGNVECFEAWNAGKLELTTGVGDVTLGMSEVRSGLAVSLESGTGNVEVNLGCSESDCAYELESGVGSVTINGGTQNSKTQRRGDLPYRLNAESGTGSVNVWFNG